MKYEDNVMKHKWVAVIEDDPVLNIRPVVSSDDGERSARYGDDPTLSVLSMASGNTLLAVFPQRTSSPDVLKAGERILWWLDSDGHIAGGYVGHSTIATSELVAPSLVLETDLRDAAFPVQSLRLVETRWRNGLLEVKWDDRISDVVVHPDGLVETPSPYLDGYVVGGINLPPELKKYFATTLSATSA